MKKLLATFLALLMMLSCVAAMAEESSTDALVVGSTTALSGNFFSDMWGNNAADVDVRALLHGYNMMQWSYEKGTYDINPAVIRGLTVENDEENGLRTYKIILHGDLVYSDGTPITTADYAFAILLAAAPEMKEIGAQQSVTEAIVGMADYAQGAAETITGVNIISKDRMNITVQADYNPYFYELALLDCVPYPISVIAPECEVADEGEGVFIRNIDAEIAEPLFTAELLQKTILDPATGYLTNPQVVSGPYTLVSFDAANGVAEFAVNENYKGNGDGVKPAIEQLTYKVVANDNMVEQLANGEIDLLHKCVTAENIDAGLALGEAFTAVEYPRSGFSFVSFNCETDIVSDPAVRKAIAMCMDKDAIVEEYVGGYGARVDGYYGLGQWMVQAVTGTLSEESAATLDEEETAAFAEMNMDGLTVYNMDVEAAKAALEEAGWTLRSTEAAEGEEPVVDAVRSKEVDGEIVYLELNMIYPEGNAIGEIMDETFVQKLAEAGVALTVEAKPMNELLEIYYSADRECDMIYLASNFARVFEPSAVFEIGGEANRTGIADEELYQLTVDMRQTEPGNVVEYTEKWLAFQAKWTELLPAIPVYSNTYYDFHTAELQGYDVATTQTWSEAIVNAYLEEVEAE